MYKLCFTLIVAISLFMGFFRFQIGLAQKAEYDEGMSKQILSSIFQINLYPAGGKYYDQGLASLVRWEEKNLLVTHNHWTVMKTLEKAEFLNAQNQLFLTLERRSFLRLILHSDPGTMVLEAPAGLEGIPTRLASVVDLKAGDRVMVAQQTAPGSSPVELRSAEIISIDNFEKYPVVHLASLDQRKTIHGDSGGGIFFGGQLVGNLWAMYAEKQSNILNPGGQITIGATFPLQILALMSESTVVNLDFDEPERKPEFGE